MKAILTLLLFITINSYSQRQMHIVYQDCSMIVITNDTTIAKTLANSSELVEYSPGWSTNYNDCVHMYWFAIESKETIIKQLNEL
jgi:hypothetical protein